MSGMYHCPECGRELRYQGLCWQCKAEWERQEVMAWTPEQIQEKLDGLIANVERVNEDPWERDFQNLLHCHGICSPELARAALEAEIYYPTELYYCAPVDVRDGLIQT